RRLRGTSIPPCGTSVGPDVLKRDLLVRRRRVARLLGRLVDLPLRFGLDRDERVLADAEVEQPFPVTRNRVLAEPLLDLFVRPVLAGIGARVAAEIGRASCRERVVISAGAGALKEKREMRARELS